MSKNCKKLLHIIFNLEKQKSIVNLESIKNYLKLVDDNNNLESDIVWLISNEYIKTDSVKNYKLTEKGLIESDRISKAMIIKEFDLKVGRLTNSKAYLDYCEEVYGYRMHLFNMMDKEQLDFLFNSINVSNQDSILDLGCGYGSILTELVKRFKCKGYGIDQLSKRVVESQDINFTYINMDMDNIREVGLKPSITISVDSLYFCSNLSEIVKHMKSLKDNRLYIFFSQYLFDTYAGKMILEYNNTTIAKVLEENNISFKYIEFSENERKLYENSLKILPKYEKAFEQEGNLDLFTNKQREDQFGKELYDAGCARRYLYIIQ